MVPSVGASSSIRETIPGSEQRARSDRPGQPGKSQRGVADSRALPPARLVYYIIGGGLMPGRPRTYKTKTGKVLTDADIETMADEAEQGYDVEMLKTRRRGRPMLGSAPSEVVPVRLDPDLKQAVEARAEADHTSTSEIIRQALRRFLDVA